MGSCMSMRRKPHQVQITNNSGLQDALIRVPRPPICHNERPIRVEKYELDRPTLQAALTAMANFIASQHQSITIVIVGGAVNTLLIQNRRFTHDIDFFGTNIDGHQRILLDDAARYAERRSQVLLGGEWFDNQTMLWLPPNIHRKVTQEALKQDEVVFEEEGLKVVAAPWRYALCGKMDRLVRPAQAQPYDITDAASYLRQHILKHGGPVPEAHIKRWCQGYLKDTSDDVILAVNIEYQHLYGEDGITF